MPDTQPRPRSATLGPFHSFPVHLPLAPSPQSFAGEAPILLSSSLDPLAMSSAHPSSSPSSPESSKAFRPTFPKLTNRRKAPTPLFLTSPTATPLRTHTKHPLPMPPAQIHVPKEVISSSSVRARSSSSAASSGSESDTTRLWYDVRQQQGGKGQRGGGVITVPEKVEVK